MIKFTVAIDSGILAEDQLRQLSSKLNIRQASPETELEEIPAHFYLTHNLHKVVKLIKTSCLGVFYVGKEDDLKKTALSDVERAGIVVIEDVHEVSNVVIDIIQELLGIMFMKNDDDF